MTESTVILSHGEVVPKKEANNRLPYEHQSRAMEALDSINKHPSYSTIVVLPTGGGKTFTASTWLLRNAINRGKKVLWLAHRQLLLDQAADSFIKFAYADTMPNVSSFRYRIVSGSERHCKIEDVHRDDQLLIVSKDSVIRKLSSLTPWLEGVREIFVLIDEAHHATAKSYRHIIDFVRDHVENVKLIGLTATPYRTAKSEAGLLAKVFTDGVDSATGQVIKGDIGIAYTIDLKTLINKHILSKPLFDSCNTDLKFGENMGLNDLEKIQQYDRLPSEIADAMAENAARNRLIVSKYLENKDEYGQTIVFALNRTHAVALNKVFKEHGVKSDYIVSNPGDTRESQANDRQENDIKLNKYKNAELEVLINVNILTEGADIPQTKTVFLARPTMSKTLMTQMIGRALRGEAAGGTDIAHIISFVDDWNKYVGWVNPDSLFDDVDNEFIDIDMLPKPKEIELLSIAKIEEFSKILDGSVDTSAIESVDFIQRVPIGMYMFSYVLDHSDIGEDSLDKSCQVMVYDSTKVAYEQMMEALPSLFEEFDAVDKDASTLSQNSIAAMCDECAESFFNVDMIPPYDERDMVNILRYYADKGIAPQFYPFDDITRQKLDISKIARDIVDRDMGSRQQAEYLNLLWESTDDNILKLFFTRKPYFVRMVNIEIEKLTMPELYGKA